MIIIKEFPDRQFFSKEEMFKALKDNKSTLIASKKMQTKEADAICYYVEVENEKGETVKAESLSNANVSKLKAVLAINTTNLLDSHGDMHSKGLWKKSVSEQRNILLLQEHKMTFDKIISDRVIASTKIQSWTKLGFDFEGNTEVLIFTADIDKSRNPYMFEQYAKGYVKEHSVGMRYVKLELCINSEERWARDEKENWDKYYPEIANKDLADDLGYFWAILEAKVVEGSAVVKGSNYATPTISIEAVSDTSKNEPSKDTRILEALENLKTKTLLK